MKLPWWRRWSWTRRRRRDIKVLWPLCVEEAGGDLDLARGTFMFYVQGSPPWEALGREGFKSTVEGLK
jgi:hypothetical protein